MADKSAGQTDGGWTPLPPEPRPYSRIVLIACGLVALAFIVGVASSGDDELPTSAPASSPETPSATEAAAPETTVDPARKKSRLACDHFRNVLADAQEGLLTDSELRGKLKEIHENSVIGTPAVQEAARDMLAAVTRGDNEALKAARDEMYSACIAAGH